MICALMAVPQAATGQEVQADSAATHVVRPGDTLWDLSGRYLGDPFRWPEIFSANRESIANPDLIFPQNRLRIPGRTAGVAVLPEAGRDSVAEIGIPGAIVGDPPMVEGPTVFATPARSDADRDAATLRLTPPEEVATVPPGAFYAAGILVREAEIAPIGELVEVVSPTVIPRRGQPQIQPYDRVYVRLAAAVQIGERLHLMRRSREIAPYGRIFVPTGEAVVLGVEEGIATVEVDRFYEAVEVGDLAVPLPEHAARVGEVPAPRSGLDGTLVAFLTTGPVASTEDQAFVNLGAASGVVEGDEFEVYRPAELAEWGRRPEVVIGRLQVVRAGAETSAVRVVALEHPDLVTGLPVRLVAKMP